MSTESIQLSFDDLTKKVSQEWIDSGKGQLQLAEEEAKVRKQNSSFTSYKFDGTDFLKFEGTESKLIYFPERFPYDDPKGEINTGRPVYKIWLQKIKRSVVEKTYEEVEQNEDYQAYVEDFEETKTDPKARPQRPQYRHYVYVIELSPSGNKAFTWDMSDTAFSEAFTEHLTKEDRVLEVKKNKEGRGWIMKIPKADKLKAVVSA